jgi:hypothetical protein
MKFRKKPVVVEAMQFMGGRRGAYEIVRWANSPNVESLYLSLEPDAATLIIIQTPEGQLSAAKGDWVIKGINGEFYPCKPDIFEKTYERVG